MEVVLNVTRRCNFRCSYCTVSKSDAVMDLRTAERAVGLSFSSGDRRHVIGFYGGEPLLEFELVCRIVDHAERNLPEGHHLSFTLTDNCYLLDDEVIDYLSRHGFTVAASYDGPLHDRQRPLSDGTPSSPVVKKNIGDLLRRMPSTPVMATVTREGCSTLPEIIKDLASMGVLCVSLNMDSLEKDWDFQELEHSFRSAVSAAREYDIIISQVDSVAAAERHGGRPHCGAGRRRIAVDTDGTIYPCTAFLGDREYAIGNVLGGIDEDERNRSYSESQIIPRKCIGCGYGKYCRTDCLCRRYRSCGRIDDFSDAHCRMTRMFAEAYWNEYGKH